jgi:deazaflavin-dependent oxidoreductase (nitroreductase family)
MTPEPDYAPSSSKYVRDQVALYESSGGTEGNTMLGKPVVIVTSVGAKSGRLRKTPLMRVEHDGSYALVASQGGAPKHPVWYFNLKANPEIELQDGPERKKYLTRELSGEERATWWQRAVEAFGNYADYQVKTEREIPVFVAEPA